MCHNNLVAWSYNVLHLESEAFVGWVGLTQGFVAEEEAIRARPNSVEDV